MGNKALVIGIDNYGFSRLNCSVNDANSVSSLLSKNYDKTKNFHVKLVTDCEATKNNLNTLLKELFNDNEADTVLLYFSGHGFDNSFDGSIVTIDATVDNPGIRMTDIMRLVTNSPSRNKIIILDCCFSGKFGNQGIIGDQVVLPEGTTILTASAKDQYSFEMQDGENGVFTNLLIEALRGGASDILGRITPGSIYAYIDQALGSWEQRPLFKTNVSSFVNLRSVKPKINVETLSHLTTLFENSKDEFKLDPSFEPTNTPNSVHRHLEPYAEVDKTIIFEKLQKMNRHGLVVPVNADHMYFAAMNSTGCKLTPLGRHYWHLVKNNLI